MSEDNIQLDLTKIQETLKCPITMENFTEPVFVPECGHTFDRKELMKLPNKKCPLSNCSFSDEPIDFKFNWLAVSMLNINVKEPENQFGSSIVNYNAKKAIEDRIKYITDKVLLNILLRVKELTSMGKGYCQVDTSKMEKCIIEPLKNMLIDRGFRINDGYTCIELRW